MNQSLPFLRIIAAAIFFAWSYRAEFLRAISIPLLALAVVWGAWITFTEKLPWGFAWGIALLYGLSFSFLAVTCHRLVLADPAERFKPLAAKPGYREIKFLGWLIVIYLIKALVVVILLNVFQDAVGRWFVQDGTGVSGWGKQLLSVPGLYVLARLSLILPATAIDQRAGLRWSWSRTRGNGWRIFVVVGLFPWLMEEVFDLVVREEASAVEQAVWFILAYVVIAIELAALSLTYRELVMRDAEAADEGNVPTGIAAVDVPEGAVSRNRMVWILVAVGLFLAYLLLGAWPSHTSDCNNTALGSASSPSGTYKASLVSRTCKKGSLEQGLVLEIVKTIQPNQIYDYPLSHAIPAGVEVAWNSDRSLIVKYKGSFDASSSPPVLLDGVRLVLEPK